MIGVTGGKGGTGKSTIATSLAYYLSQNHKVLLVDADVDCPNDHLLLKPSLIRKKEVLSFIPNFDLEKCTYCGLCSQNCREHAIIVVKQSRKLLFFPEQCNGCKTCLFVCPEKAISTGKQVVGEIRDYKVTKNLMLKSGFLKPGVEETSIVVSELMKDVMTEKDNYDFVIVDTAAGTHCNVTKALYYVDKVLLVTEPTPLGLNDLKLIIKVIKEMNKFEDVKIVINKAGLSDEYEDKITQFGEDNNIKVLSRISYNREIIEKYVSSEPIINPSIRKIGEYYEGL